MKRYLLIAVAVLFVGLNASENPFDEENIGNIDDEQNLLLNDLKNSSSSKKPRHTVEEVEVITEDVTPVIEVEEEVVDNKKSTQEYIKELEGVQEVKEVKEVKEVPEVKEVKEVIEEVKEVQPKLTKEQIRLKKEKEEVEAYERSRAKKREEALKAKKSQKIEEIKSDIAKEVEKKAKKEEATKDDVEVTVIKVEEEKKPTPKKEKVKKEVVKKPKTVAKPKTEEVPPPLDINVTREKKQAKIAADILYLEAIKEMDREED